MKNLLRYCFVAITAALISVNLSGCGQSIGYQEVDTEVRYYHSTTPQWLPSAAGPGRKVYRTLVDVNREQFQIFGAIAKDDNQVWYLGLPIIEADAESFISLEGDYQKDKFTVYRRGIPIEGVASNEFEVIWVHAVNKDMAYGRTRTDVFYQEKPLSVSSISDFEFIARHDFWARDGSNYFYYDKKITVGNYNDIQIIGSGWLKDDQFVFNAEGEKLIIENQNEIDMPSLDLDTIEQSEHHAYLRDKHGYIDVYSKKRVSVSDYKYQLKNYE